MAIVGFACIYIILAVMLGYLLTSNTGLDIIKKTGFDTAKPELAFKNISARTINNITISVIEGSGKKTEIMKIQKTGPGEEMPINLPPLLNFPAANLVAESPFYQAQAKFFSLAGTKTGLNYEIKFPTFVFANNTFKFELVACNGFEAIKKVSVQPVFDKKFFDGETKTNTIVVPQKECAKTDYTLTPKKTGQTTILFNIEVENNKDQISKTIEVMS
ncbi:MAG: hypothetical protein AABW85_04920 [archaeon]